MMSATKTARSSARWRRKKLEEGAQEFRAKEALRIKNYRARKRERRAQGLTVRDANELSDDVDTWLNNVVEDQCPRRSSSHVPPSRPASPAWSSVSSTEDSRANKDDNTAPTPISFQDARKIIANGQKMLQEWNERWGTTTSNSSFRTVNASLEFGGLVKMTPAVDHHRGEIMTMIRNGREVLLQLQSIAHLDFRSVPAGDFPNFWMESVRVIEGLHEQIAHADVALQMMSFSDTQTRTQTRT